MFQRTMWCGPGAISPDWRRAWPAKCGPRCLAEHNIVSTFAGHTETVRPESVCQLIWRLQLLKNRSWFPWFVENRLSKSKTLPDKMPERAGSCKFWITLLVRWLATRQRHGAMHSLRKEMLDSAHFVRPTGEELWASSRLAASIGLR